MEISLIRRRRHVFRDLRPYICTFPACQTPERLYASRSEWMYHEMQTHLRRWKCEDCDLEYESRQAMEAHIKTSHPQHAGPKQLQIMLDICNRPIHDGLLSCPLCPAQSLVLFHRRFHLAQHMEDIALFTIPRSAEEDHESCSVFEKPDQQNPDDDESLPIVSLASQSES